MAETADAGAGIATGAAGGRGCDPVTAAAGVRGIGGKPRCC